MGIDVEAARAATPGCRRLAHLNNAGAALPPSPVVEAVVAHLRLEAEIGGYEAAAARERELAAVRDGAARLLGADPSEVALTTSDTAAWAKLFWGLVHGRVVRAGDRVVVDRIAYNSHYLALLQAGVEIDAAASLPDGSLDLEDLARRLPGAVLVAATHVGTHRGLVNPAAEIGALARQHGVLYALDACQSAGQLPLDIAALGCHALTATGRKWLRGPRGAGLLWVQEELSERLDPPGIDGASAAWLDAGRYELAPGARRFEEFEASVAVRLGLGAALDYALALGINEVAARVQALAARLRDELAARPGVTVHDGGSQRCGIVTFTVADRSAEEVVAALGAGGVNGSVSAPGWARLDLAAPVVRLSPHYYNTELELERAVELAVGA